MDRVSIKERAKKIAKENLWNYWKPMLLVFVISYLLPLVTGIISEEGTLLNSILSLVTTALVAPLQVGVIAYILRIVRGQGADLNLLKDYFDKFLVIFLVSLVTGILSSIGMVLLIVPGIIVILALAMVNYIIADNKEVDVKGALLASKEMMDGYKLDFLVFSLSFLGWIIVGILTLGIGLIWVLPYMSYASAIYYDELKAKKAN